MMFPLASRGRNCVVTSLTQKTVTQKTCNPIQSPQQITRSTMRLRVPPRSRLHLDRMIRHGLVCVFVLGTSIVGCGGFLMRAPSSATRQRASDSKHHYVGVVRLPWKAAAGDMQDEPEANHASKDSFGNIVFLLPSSGSDSTTLRFGSRSPIGNPTIADAAAHLVNKSYWFSEGLIAAQIVEVSDACFDDETKKLLEEADALIALGLTAGSDLEFAQSVFDARLRRDMSLRSRQCQFGLECANSRILPEMVGRYDDSSCSFLVDIAPWTEMASARRMYEQMIGLFDRWTSDDFTVALMIFFNQFSGTEIQWVKHSIDVTWEKGPIRNLKEIFGMATKCGDCIATCLGDEKCNECMNALTKLDTRDQVSSYRTIVSYESQLLTDFSFCIMQKNNIFECHSTIPTMPKVSPISMWRGESLTTDLARSILTGHLDDELAPTGSARLDVSWKVAAGANVAYDQFPSQNQLFYESANGRDMWYDPVFRVETIDGRNVWCKRHYRVRNGKIPGTFHLSVLDNGVTSNEFWTIAGIADDMSWIVFHYAGAAAAVGQTYIGGLLCTADGSLPPSGRHEEVWRALRGAGIQPWELFVVDNDPNSPGMLEAGPPPLQYFRDSVLAAKARMESVAS